MFPGMARDRFVQGIAIFDTFIEPKWIVVVKIDEQSIRKAGTLVNSLSNGVRRTKQDRLRILGGQVLTVRGDVTQD